MLNSISSGLSVFSVYECCLLWGRVSQFETPYSFSCWHCGPVQQCLALQTFTAIKDLICCLKLQTLPDKVPHSSCPPCDCSCPCMLPKCLNTKQSGKLLFLNNRSINAGTLTSWICAKEAGKANRYLPGPATARTSILLHANIIKLNQQLY